MKTDLDWTICSVAHARANPVLLKQAVRRAFLGMKDLLQSIPIVVPLRSMLDEGLRMMDNAVPATREYVDKNRHPVPRDIAEAQDVYDMVLNERACFIGKPTNLMLRRWAMNVITVVNYLENVGAKQSSLYTDAVDLCETILARAKSWCVCLSCIPFPSVSSERFSPLQSNCEYHRNIQKQTHQLKNEHRDWHRASASSCCEITPFSPATTISTRYFTSSCCMRSLGRRRSHSRIT